MKKVFYSLAAMALVSLGMTSCQKEEGQAYSFTAGFDKSFADNGAKMDLDDNIFHWAEGDIVQVFIGYNTTGIYYDATPDPDDPTFAEFTLDRNYSNNTGQDPERAIFPAGAGFQTGGRSVVLEELQQSTDGLLHEFPMYAEFTNVTWTNHHSSGPVYFKNLCGLLKIHMQQAGESIKQIDLTADQAVRGKFAINNNDPEHPFCYRSPSTPDYYFGNTVSLQFFGNGSWHPQDITDGRDFYIFLPPGTYTNVTLTFTDDQDGTCTKSCSSLTVERSKVHPITISGAMNFVNPNQGTLSGVFSVSSTEKVRFSQGNLQYQASTGTWRFAEHQYDIVGAGNANISSTYTGWIDLFGWGTSGYHNPSDALNVNYQPYSTSNEFVSRRSADLNNNTFGYGPSRNMTDTNLIGTSANYDWGVYNAISNGGCQAGIWRTLTDFEWYYLTHRSNKQLFARVMVSTNTYVNGFVLLPDEFTFPEGLTVIQYNTNYSTNTFTPAQWSQMEAAGAVFLPAAGYRYYSGSATSYTSNSNIYWSSATYYHRDGPSAYAGSYTFSPTASLISEYTHHARYFGLAVRLVKDVVSTSK